MPKLFFFLLLTQHQIRTELYHIIMFCVRQSTSYLLLFFSETGRLLKMLTTNYYVVFILYLGTAVNVYYILSFQKR